MLDYLTLILKTVTVSTDISEYTAQYLGQLNTTYVQTNSEVSPQIYATLKTPSVYIPVSALLRACCERSHLARCETQTCCEKKINSQLPSGNLTPILRAPSPMTTHLRPSAGCLLTLCDDKHAHSSTLATKLMASCHELVFVCRHLVCTVYDSSNTPHMAMPSTNIFESKSWPLFALQYDTPILDPALGLTESECIVRAKNYTLTQANVQGTPPANVWNYCSTGVCNYTMVNGTQGTFISPYAGTHTTSICQMGYSAAVDSNEYVEPAYITGIGQGTAGESSAASVCLCMLW